MFICEHRNFQLAIIFLLFSTCFTNSIDGSSSALPTKPETLGSVFGHYTMTISTTVIIPVSAAEIYHLDGVTSTTTTDTMTLTGPVTTITVFVSLRSISNEIATVSASEVMITSTSTGLCGGHHHDVLTPCSSLIVKTETMKSTSASEEGKYSGKKSTAMDWIGHLPLNIRFGIMAEAGMVVGILGLDIGKLILAIVGLLIGVNL